MKLTLQLSALFLALLLLGCGEKKTPEEETVDSSSSHAEPEPEDLGPPLPGEPTVEVWNWEQTLEAVKKHQGKVVVLHIWASWNEDLNDPANEGPEDRRHQMELLARYGFDEFVRMKKLYRDDIVAISLNTDYNYDNQDQPPETHKDKVLEFVKAHGANFEHGISSVLEGELQDSLGIVGTPATLVFDKKGELRHKFFHEDEAEKPYSYREDVIPFALNLVKEEYTAAIKPSEAQPSENDGTSESVSVEIRDWEGLQKMVKEARGKVVVVDYWSTQCGPCIKEFPNLVKLHNERKPDVTCISFNMDFTGRGKPEDAKEVVHEFLKGQNATLFNVISRDKDDNIYGKKISSYSIPVVQIYDRQGNLRKEFDDSLGEFTYAKDVLPFVETLIQEK